MSLNRMAIATALASIALLGASRSAGAQPHHRQPTATAPTTPPAAATPASVRFDRVRLSTGVTVNVAEAGDPMGQPVIFLHGYSDSWFSWSLVVDRLPPGVRAIMLDQRGHGRSDKPECCYRYEDLAKDAVALLDRLGISRATVVGHSLGSLVAQHVAVAAPDRVSKLVLLGSGEAVQPALAKEIATALAQFTDTVPAEFVKEFQLSTIRGPLPDGFLDRVLQESALMPLHAWRGIASGLVADSLGVASRITAPTLILAAELDAPFPPEFSWALGKRIRNSKVVEYAKTGHAIHWEQPDRFVRDLMAFIGK